VIEVANVQIAYCTNNPEIHTFNGPLT